MSKHLNEVMLAYKAENFAQVYKLLKPILRSGADVGAQFFLMFAQACTKIQQFGEAATSYRTAAQLLPDQAEPLRDLAEKLSWKHVETHQVHEIIGLVTARKAIRSSNCDEATWKKYRALLREGLNIDETRIMDQAILDHLHRGDTAYFSLDTPRQHLTWCDHEALSHAIAAPPHQQSERINRSVEEKSVSPRIKIGYCLGRASAGSSLHNLIIDIAGRHDRTRFEVWLITDQSKRIASAGSVKTLSLAKIPPKAERSAIEAAGFDIIIDAWGHSGDGRPDLLQHRLAPLQIAIAGFPGPRHGLICDYFVGDSTTLPPNAQAFYGQACCHLPDAFIAGLPEKPAASSSRQNMGIAQETVILLSLHPIDKISPKTADIWLQILKKTDNSLLCMVCDNIRAQFNFLAWLKRNDIAAKRVMFVSPQNSQEQQQLLGIADIALDCFPYNGQFTNIRALGAGVPLATFTGGHFASRMSASLLRACGLEKLIVADAQAYIALMINLAQNPQVLLDLKKDVQSAVKTATLFKPDRFTRHLEAAYCTMHQRTIDGIPPSNFAVEA
ncbi:hypothetical protein [Rhizobium sp.]|jgi:predicted O-linked N-acetylglucosamine transferase (SPINDLY family)|uniref:O-linked N-acetylglucosamine transferase family protein n=1 Tax=Rhizobium sp. TaxID=391 RepID=UPI000E88570E|nr:hypothetical protein [Rhizobium sp.]